MEIQYNIEKMINKSKEILSSDSLVTKIVFFLLVIIAFFLILRLGTALLSYIIAPKPDPYLISGMINSKKLYSIPQDPKTKGSIPILRSVDKNPCPEYDF